MSSSPTGDCPATTPERYSRPLAVRHFLDDRSGFCWSRMSPENGNARNGAAMRVRPGTEGVAFGERGRHVRRMAVPVGDGAEGDVPARVRVVELAPQPVRRHQVSASVVASQTAAGSEPTVSRSSSSFPQPARRPPGEVAGADREQPTAIQRRRGYQCVSARACPGNITAWCRPAASHGRSWSRSGQSQVAERPRLPSASRLPTAWRRARPRWRRRRCRAPPPRARCRYHQKRGNGPFTPTLSPSEGERENAASGGTGKMRPEEKEKEKEKSRR